MYFHFDKLKKYKLVYVYDINVPFGPNEQYSNLILLTKVSLSGSIH